MDGVPSFWGPLANPSPPKLRFRLKLHDGSAIHKFTNAVAQARSADFVGRNLVGTLGGEGAGLLSQRSIKLCSFDAKATWVCLAPLVPKKEVGGGVVMGRSSPGNKGHLLAPSGSNTQIQACGIWEAFGRGTHPLVSKASGNRAEPRPGGCDPFFWIPDL